jgi:hypothetical protein
MPYRRVLLSLILIAGALLRLYFLNASQWLVEGDEAAVGLQALQILRGEHPIFYPGQAYLGNFESYLVAAVFAVSGASAAALRVVPFIFALIFIYLCYYLGAELFDDERAGLFAALMSAIAPVYFVMWSIKARGGYIEALVLAQLALLWFHRWLAPVRDTELRAPQSASFAALAPPFLFGLIGGYALWMNPLTVYVLGPIAIILAFHAVVGLFGAQSRRRAISLAASAVLGTCIAWLPLLLFRLAYGDTVFQVVTNNVPSQKAWADLIGQSWLYFWHDGLPTLLGLRGPKDKPFALDGRVVVVPVYAAALLWTIARARQAVVNASTLTFAGDEPRTWRGIAFLPLMAIVAFPIFAFGSITGGNFSAIIPDSGLLTRYLLPLYLLFVLALGLLCASLRIHWRLLVLFVVLGINIWTVTVTDAVALSRNEFANQPLPARNDDLLSFLSSHDLRFVYTNHWIGYVLMLESRERVITYDYTDTRYDTDRFPAYSRMVQQSSNPALVIFNPQHEPNPIDARLAQLGITFTKGVLPAYIVYYDLAPRLQPAALDNVLQWPYY